MISGATIDNTVRVTIIAVLFMAIKLSVVHPEHMTNGQLLSSASSFQSRRLDALYAIDSDERPRRVFRLKKQPDINHQYQPSYVSHPDGDQYRYRSQHHFIEDPTAVRFRPQDEPVEVAETPVVEDQPKSSDDYEDTRDAQPSKPRVIRPEVLLPNVDIRQQFPPNNQPRHQRPPNRGSFNADHLLEDDQSVPPYKKPLPRSTTTTTTTTTTPPPPPPQPQPRPYQEQPSFRPRFAGRPLGGRGRRRRTTTTTTTTTTTPPPSNYEYDDYDYYEYEDTTTTTTTTPPPPRRGRGRGRRPRPQYYNNYNNQNGQSQPQQGQPQPRPRPPRPPPPPPTTTTTTTPSTTTRRLSPGYKPRPDNRIIDYQADPNFPHELKGADLTNYPFYITIPENIDFNCKGRHDGYYANIQLSCQVYHHCAIGNRYDFLCPNYTLFDQTTFTCRFINTVDCVNSENHYDRNNELYVESTTAAPSSTNNGSTNNVNNNNSNSQGSNRTKRSDEDDRKLNETLTTSFNRQQLSNLGNNQTNFDTYD